MLPPHPPRQPLAYLIKAGALGDVRFMWYAPRNAGERTTDVLSGKRDNKSSKVFCHFDPPPAGCCGPYNLSWVAAGRLKPWGKSLRSARLIRRLISRGFLSCRLQKTSACPPKTSPHSAIHNTHYVSLPKAYATCYPLRTIFLPDRPSAPRGSQ